MLLKIVIALAVIVGVLVVVVATRPAGFKVERTTSVAAPATIIYANVSDFHSWAPWSPWAKLDPDMKTSYSGADGTPGASYTWMGNDKVGQGRMTVVSAQPPSTLIIKLEFLKPFAATNETDFTFVQQGGNTLVTWSMTGSYNFMAKAMSMIMDMDKMVGGDFDKGLAQLKTLSEAQAKAQAAAAAPAPSPSAAPVPPATAPSPTAVTGK